MKKHESELEFSNRKGKSVSVSVLDITKSHPYNYNFSNFWSYITLFEVSNSCQRYSILGCYNNSVVYALGALIMLV